MLFGAQRIKYISGGFTVKYLWQNQTFLKKNQSYADDSKSEDRVMVSKGWVSLSAFSCSFFPWWAILRGTWVALEFVLRFL